MSDEPMPAWAARMEARILARLDELQERIDGHADDLKVNLASAVAAEDATDRFEEELRRQQIGAVQRVRGLAQKVAAMERQILRLEDRLNRLAP
jgi:hypothetical protein